MGMSEFLGVLLVTFYCTLISTEASVTVCRVNFKYPDITHQVWLFSYNTRHCIGEYEGTAYGCNQTEVICKPTVREQHNHTRPDVFNYDDECRGKRTLDDNGDADCPDGFDERTQDLLPNRCRQILHIDGEQRISTFNRSEEIKPCPACYEVVDVEPKCELTYDKNCNLSTYCEKSTCGETCNVKFFYPGFSKTVRVNANAVIKCDEGYDGLAIGCQRRVVTCRVGHNFCLFVRQYQKGNRYNLLAKNELSKSCGPCHNIREKRKPCVRREQKHVCTYNATGDVKGDDACCEVSIFTPEYTDFLYLYKYHLVPAHLCPPHMQFVNPTMTRQVCSGGRAINVHCEYKTTGSNGGN